MKRSALLRFSGVFIIFALVACGPKTEESHEVATDKDKTHVDTTAASYICPMNCEGSASDKPGKCKVCGMDLEEKK
jgi:hypothetical protein